MIHRYTLICTKIQYTLITYTHACTLTDMNDKQRRNITLPPELNTRLSKEGNASRTIETALLKHYSTGDTAKQLIQLANTIDSELTRLAEAVEHNNRTIKNVARFMNSQGADIAV